MQKLVPLVIAIAACGSDKAKQEPAPAKEQVKAPEPVEAAPKPPAPPPAPESWCKLSGTGAATFDQTTPGGRSAVSVSYWFSDEERKKMMGGDGFSVSCNGDGIRFSIIPGGKTNKDTAPMKPKTYKLDKGKGDISVLATIGKSQLTAPSGTIDVTAFDGHHIAGTIALAGKLVPGTGELKLTGSFDLQCPGYKGCAK
jgi:hypothetical protein